MIRGSRKTAAVDGLVASITRFIKGLPPGAIFGGAFLLALLIGFAQLSSPRTERPPLSGDSAKYHALAEGVEQLLTQPALWPDLLTGDLAPEVREELGLDRWEFQHAPAYVIPLGLGYALMPNNEGVGRAFSLIFYAASAGLLLVISRRLLGPYWCWLALAGYLLYLPLLYFATGIQTEGFGGLVLLLVSYLLLQWHRRPRRSTAVRLGLGLALLFLAKTTFRPLALLFLAGELGWLLRGREKRRFGLPLALAALVPLGLWYGALLAAHIPVENVSRTGESQLWLYRGNYVPNQGWETTAMGDPINEIIDEAGKELREAGGDEMTPDERQRELYGRALRKALARYPTSWVALVAKKARLFWTYPARKTSLPTVLGDYWIPRWIHLCLYPLGLLGLAVLLRRSPALCLPALLALGVSGVHALSHLVARYQIPALPIWGIIALVGLRAIPVTLRRLWARRASLPRKDMRWGLPLLAALLVILGWGLTAPALGRSVSSGWRWYVLGATLLGLGLALLGPFLAFLGRLADGARRRSAWWLGVGPLIFGLTAVGEILSEPDWDAFSATLRKPGDMLIQRIPVGNPQLTKPELFTGAWLEIDLLRSIEGSFALEVSAGGEHLQTFTDSLGAAYESFLFDPAIHPAQDRYRRWADKCAHFVDRRLAREYGERNPRFDYFRRWVRVPVPQRLLGGDFLQVELKLTNATGGGWIRVYGDRFPEQGEGRGFHGPAMGENPNDFSHYRAEFFGGDRERMDARLTCRHLLRSREAVSQRLQGGRRVRLGDRPGQGAGELRVRLRVALQGALVYRDDEAGASQRIWTLTPQPEDRLVDPAGIRKFRWWRSAHFDGTWIY